MSTSFIKFIILWASQLIAGIGHGASAFALGVYAFEINRSAFASSLVMLFGFLPEVLLSVPAGVLADRFDRRLLMILGDGLSALGLVLILLLKQFGQLSLPGILIGVSISSIFSALLRPAYQATVSDLLEPSEYTRASGMIQIASSAHFLVSPLLAASLMIHVGLEIILLFDIATIFLTIIASHHIRKGLKSKPLQDKTYFLEDLKEGWTILRRNTGVFQLVLIATALTFFMGFIQTLSTPFILSFSNQQALGQALSISATGLLVSGLFLSFISITSHHVLILTISLFLSGLFMIGFGSTQKMVYIMGFGFLFFSSLAPINACLDYLVRLHIDNRYQGRVWAFIGLISQMGFVAAYFISGGLADLFFTPALMEGGILSNTVGKILGTGAGRGIGFEIMLAGTLLSLSAIVLFFDKHIHSLEHTRES